jgi:hypothetical protein
MKCFKEGCEKMVCFEADQCKPEPKPRSGFNWPLLALFAAGVVFWAVVIWSLL